jgi:hypothetical protein
MKSVSPGKKKVSELNPASRVGIRRKQKLIFGTKSRRHKGRKPVE